MKKFLRKFLILFLVFAAGVTITSLLQNHRTTDNRSDMNEPVLPEVMVQFGNTAANRMSGYTQEMQTDFMRDSITPIDTTKQLTFLIVPYGTEVKSLSYEIRTSDGSKVIENRKIKNLSSGEEHLEALVTINSDLLMNQEYSLQISLDTEKGPAYYYTRLVSRTQLNTEQYLKFVNSFYEKCMDKETAEELTAYLEAGTTGSGMNFSDVNIGSTFATISWGDLKPQIYKKGVPVIKDINETTASVSIDYQISAIADNGAIEVYDVTEFYRMRYTETRIMLLDFERSAQQVFNPKASVVSDKGLLLGVRDKDVHYVVNESGTAAAFVQQGDLWSYSPENGKIVKIFSFRGEEQEDFRYVRQEHDIKIIRMADNGDVDFVLYGYMNRGIREGYSGVGVYHYNNDQNVVEEKVFIPSTESFEFLKKDLGTLSYVSGDNMLFLLFAQKLYMVNINGGGYKILDEGIRSSSFVVSDTNAHAAWVVQSGEHKGQLKEIEFDTLKTRFLTPAEGEKLKTLGFMNEDLVYGMIKQEDILKDKNGKTTEGIHTVRIEDFDGNVKKEYKKEGLYITNVSIGNTLMEFQLSAKGESGYTFKKKDNIMNNKKAAASQVSVELTSTNRTGTLVRLAFEEKPAIDKPLVVTSKVRSVENEPVTLDTQTPDENVYYVYAKGGLEGIYTNPAQAVKKADAKTGVVLNRSQQYVWERGNKKTQIQLNIQDIPEVIRTGSWDKNKLQEGLGETGTVLDLSGCSLDSVLYEVSAQRAVVAKTGSDTSAVIVGYDEYNTWLYDPATGETKPYGMNDSTELFQKAGNVFVSYVEKPGY